MHMINRRTGQALHVLLISALLIAGLGMGGVSPAAASGEASPSAQAGATGISGFKLISVDQGWVLSDNQLYWTADGGESWNLISAGLPEGPTLVAVDFSDSQEGRVLMMDAAGEDPVYSLGSTHDGGATWETGTLSLFAAVDVNASADKVFMQWLDAQTGWLVIKRASGINFSMGSLFRTEDGGLTWNQLSIPIGEAVDFITAQVGWAAGGAAGDELYRTEDGGATWDSQAFVQTAGTPGERLAYLPPKFEDVNNGLLPVMVSEGNNVRMDFYATADGGGTWKLVNSAALDENTDLSVRPALSILDASHFTMAVPGSDRIVSEQGGQQISTRYNLDGRSGDLTRIEMASMEVGLGLFSAGECVDQGSSVPPSDADGKGNLSCTQTKELLKTSDGGATWNPVALPGAAVAAQGSGSFGSTIGQGVDICDIPSAAILQGWWAGSPYGAVNLYIGGSMRGCTNTRLNAALVAQLFQQGWKFIPTWVGPQAPCSVFRDKVSLDPDTAYQQGTSEAEAAITAAAALGLTAADGSNTVIYYDLEGYNTADSGCRAAMKSFMDGWDGQLAARGNASGVYGSACASALSDFAGIPHVPDAVWPAWWNFTTYNGSASVMGIVCLSNSYWVDHQRIHQYTGDHDETWGGITINIDDNVMDGVLAVPYEGSGSSAPSQPATPKPIDGGTLPRTQDTWLYWSTNGSSCNVHIWGAGIDTTSNGNCASVHPGQLAPGVYLWQVTAINSNGSSLGPVWHFNVQPYAPTGLTLETVTSTKVSLGWTLSADDPDNLDGYAVYVNNAFAASLPKGTNSYTLSGLACNAAYSVFVRSTRQNVQSVNSNSVTTTTGSCAEAIYILSGNAGAAGATLTYNGGSTTADSAGAYSIPVPYNWSGTVTPALTGYVFSPASRTYSNVKTDQPLQDYAALPLPGAVDKVSPANNASDQPATLSLSWTTSANATSYDTCVNTTASCVAWTPAGANTSLTLTGLTPGLHYWQVRANNEVGTTYGNGSSSAWWSFTVIQAPGDFSKVSPANGTVIKVSNPSLSWGTSAKAASYWYCINKTASCSAPAAWTSAGSSTSIALSGLTAGTYYWQVQAMNGSGIPTNANGGAWWSFTFKGKTTFNDYDGDGRTDPAKFEPATGMLSYLSSKTGAWVNVFMGSDSYSIVPGSDFDGDGRTDAAKFVPAANALWYLASSTGTWQGIYMGPGTFTLVNGGDYDGDGKTDPAHFNSNGNALWYLASSTGTWQGVYLGPGTYQMVPASDFDGDGRTDPAQFVSTANALWYLASSSGTWQGIYMGPGSYQIVAASDFDGDSKTDQAHFNPDGNSLWYLPSSTGTWQGIYLGPGTYNYIAGSDFDGDGKTDPALFMPGANSLWYLKSSTGTWVGVYMGSGTYKMVN